ncbi:MAG: formyltransferase family protein [Halanaerobium sp.]|nr:formyltransferase family protein [Halanaerobium sp.]
MMKVVIATVKSWNIKLAKQLKKERDDLEIFLITAKADLHQEVIKDINPSYIFFPHWSWKIPPEVYKNYRCIVFHMTDLPYGRGGSPLQNLIIRGLEDTKITAIRVDAGMDTGDIYLQEKLNLNGTAEEIFIRAGKVIFRKMIPEIIQGKTHPVPQRGETVRFTRRKPSESEIKPDFDLEKVYDFIRMLDAEGYPKAFIKFGNYRMEFSRASLKADKLIADVQIVRDDVYE